MDQDRLGQGSDGSAVSDEGRPTFTAFVGPRRLASGALRDVALAVKALAAEGGDPVLTFDDRSGSVVDLDLRGTEADVVARLARREAADAAASGRVSRPDSEGAARGRGRPKLGVIAREVTLLPVSGSGSRRSPAAPRRRCGASSTRRGARMTDRPGCGLPARPPTASSPPWRAIAPVSRR